MQKTAPGVRPGTAYRERLSPSLWVLISAAVCAPMAALVLAPIDTTLALVAGLTVGLVIIWALVALAPVVSVRDGSLHAGRAWIDLRYAGEPVPHVGAEARQKRGPGLSARSWHLLRPGIDGVVVVPVVDDDDPVSEWVISTRTPDRLAAAIRAERSAR